MGWRFWVTLLIIISILIISLFLIRFFYIIYLTNNSYETLEETYLNTISTSFSGQPYYIEGEVRNVGEASISLTQAKTIVVGDINEKKLEGNTVVIDENNIEVKIINLTGFLDLTSHSMLLFLTEYQIYSLDSLERNLNNNIALTLDSLIFIAKQGFMWATISNAIDVAYDEDENGESNGKEDIHEVILSVENFERSLKVPTQGEINNINLKNSCIKAMNDASSGSFYDQARGTTLSKLLFVSKTSNICEDLEQIQKEHALRILNSLENEENSFISVNKKLYLNMFVECNSDWLPQEGVSARESCTQNYLDDFKEDLSLVLMK